MKRSPHDTYKVNLTEKELQEVKTIVKKGVCKARTITRGRILILAHERKLDKDICSALGTVRSTVLQSLFRIFLPGIMHRASDSSQRRTNIFIQFSFMCKYQYPTSGNCSRFAYAFFDDGFYFLQFFFCEIYFVCIMGRSFHTISPSFPTGKEHDIVMCEYHKKALLLSFLLVKY